MTSQGPRVRSWTALLVLLICLSLTALATQYVQYEVKKEDRLRFDREAHAMQRDIDERMETYVTSLRGVAGLFSSTKVNATVFHRYVDRIDVTRRYPGVQGIGYAPKIATADVPSLEERAKAEGLTSYHVWGSDDHTDVKVPVLYLEPQDDRNDRAMGFDMYSHPSRRAAIDSAWRSGVPVASGPVQLVQEITGPKQEGFLIYVPIYQGGEIPSSENQRLAKLIGFAYAPFRAVDLLDAILQEEKPEGVSIDIYDGTTTDPQKLLFSSDSDEAHDRPAVFESTSGIMIVSEPWTLRFHSNRNFQFGSVHGAVSGIGIAGTLLSFLFYAVIRSHARARLAAERIAAELRETSNELKRANAAKDQFLAVLSHELRTPLTPVLLSVSAMEHDEQLPEHLKEPIQVVRRNIELEARLIDDLLDLTRIARGKVQFRLERVDVHDVLSAAVRVASEDGAADAKGVKIELDLKAQQHVVRGDAARLQQIFWNIVKNSVKFTPSGGSIFVTTTSTDSHISIKVRDTGVGIEPEVLPKIFNAFEQGDRSVTRLFGGLGLGLAITKSLIDAHGGNIAAHSQGKGTGAEFVINLPTIEEQAHVETSNVPADPTPKTIAKVLLVEDHPDTSRLLAKLLRRDGYDVTTANSVDEAVKAGRSEHFDLVVSDLGLPDGSGLEILPKIKADGTPSKNIRGIALTGYGMEEDVRRSHDAGYGEHLTKPVDVRQLEQAMERQLRQ